MTPAEREALLKLWEAVPKTKPQGLEWNPPCEGRGGNFYIMGDNFGGTMLSVAAALARDAMVQWLAHRFCFVAWYAKGEWSVWKQDDFGTNDLVSEDVSLVMALIKACRSVAGK